MLGNNIKILGVVVLYRCQIEDSLTIKSLLRDYSSNAEGYNNFQLIIYDNSESEQVSKIEFPFPCSLVRDQSNPGLAKAYNTALDVARGKLIEWLLLLDQDTTLPQGYMELVNKELSVANSLKKIKAIVPLVMDNGRPISPARDLLGGILRPIKNMKPGQCSQKIHCIGSGSIVKVDLFEKIGGFSLEFPVDGLDRWLFQQIYSMGWLTYVTEIRIDHCLSIFNYDNFVGYERYIRILTYEYKFLKMYRHRMDIWIYEVRLFLRFLKYYLKFKDKNYAIITLKHALEKYNDKANNYNRNNNLQ
jgi:GT2 family glycosyltransferase